MIPTLQEISDYFETAPERSVPIGAHGIVRQSKIGAKALIQVLKENPGKREFMPYWEKLVTLYHACLDQDKAVKELLNNG